MSVRFRIRTSAGQELSFASHEMFEDFVRSGDLSPDDLVYDGESGSWAPARTHPLVLEIEYEREAEAAAAEESADGEGATDGDGATEDEGATEEIGAIEPDASVAASDPLKLDLAPMEEKAPGDESRAFVERLEAEREADLELGGSSGTIEGFTREDSGSLAGMLTPAPPTPTPPRTPTPTPTPTPTSRPSSPDDRPVPPKRPTRSERPQRRAERPPRRSAERSERTRERPRREEPRSAASPEGRGRRWMGVVLVGVVLAGVAYVAYGALGQPPSEEEADPELSAQPAPVEPPVPPPSREPVIAATEVAIRERARERFLTATQNQLRDLPPVPEVWANGSYLAMPTDYPEVVDVWQSYVATIRRVRAGDRERYRIAYEVALDDAAVDDEARGPRRAAALRDFEGSAQRREAHYGRVESLATAAIQSHNALVEAEGLILYDPGSGGGGLGAGTTGRDADAQLLLDQVLDLLSSTLEADGLGPRAGVRVREWVWDGFLDAVTR